MSLLWDLIVRVRVVDAYIWKLQVRWPGLDEGRRVGQKNDLLGTSGCQIFFHRGTIWSSYQPGEMKSPTYACSTEALTGRTSSPVPQ